MTSLLINSAVARAQAAPCLLDEDSDGLCDLWETTCLLSGGQRPDAVTPDSDNDLIRDDVEVGQGPDPIDSDGQGYIDACDDDSDGDGYTDRVESACEFMCTDPADTDGDGDKDYRDTDSDNDGRADDQEPVGDTDGDGVDDRRDPDSDDDGIPDGDDPDPSTPDDGGSKPNPGSGIPTPGGNNNPGNGDGSEADPAFTVASGGCSTSTSSSSSLALLLVAAAVLMRRRNRMLLAAALVAAPNAGRADGLNTDSIRTNLIGEGGVAVSNTDTLAAGAIRISTMGDFSDDPLELRDENGDRAAGLVDSVTSMALRVAIGLPKNFEVSALAPFVLDQQVGDMASSARGIGDVGVAAKWSARPGRRVGFALATEVIFPTGDEGSMAGDGTVGAQIQAMGDVALGPLRVGGMAGVRFRGDEASFQDASVGNQALWGAIADWGIAARLNLVGEVHGAVGIDSSESPVEALGGLRYSFGSWMAVAGGGAALSSSVGAPEWRAFLGGAVTLGGREEPRHAPVRFLPVDPPDERVEERTAPADSVAPPIPVITDADGDGLDDDDDKCKSEPETRNGFDDDDGCPDTSPAYVFTKDAPLVFHNILFDTGKYRILPESYPVLDEIATSLTAQPKIRVRIDGHTDARGTAQANLALSQQRALAISNYLVAAGIDAARVEYEGFGESRPVDTNNTATGQQNNRRVELRVIGDDHE
ncbi:MAG: OmpA family protein [Kofleriaceae bacterium]